MNAQSVLTWEHRIRLLAILYKQGISLVMLIVFPFGWLPVVFLLVEFSFALVFFIFSLFRAIPNMRIPSFALFTLLLSFHALAAPVLDTDELAVECLPAKKRSTPAVIETKARRMLNAFTREVRIADRTLFGLIRPRLTAGNEFVGWHGTNEDTATLWETSGEIVKPVTAEGQTRGRSGLDAELGSGLYISDTLSVAESAAAANSQNNGIPGKVCAIFAKSSADFRASQDKIQIPETIRGNSDIRGEERASYISNLPPSGTGNVASSLLLGPLTGTKNQMLIPESQNPTFEAQCFDVVGLDSAGAAAFEQANGAISYTDAALIQAWQIRQEDLELAAATIAAFEKPGAPDGQEGCVVQ
ncbi:hypothetical protein R3P38DRAFT_1639323 [Favolaschia claudopus]|uniref:Uncharacterized protein n=1 Tax=Favolaschia claudopus TaxID=2862362 RepID=A0AAW0DHJ5_9AGAR